MCSVGRVIISAILGAVLLAPSLRANAQNSSSEVTIEDEGARTALEQGMNAVKLRAWDKATLEFSKALDRERKPNPVIYFNLGLALEKAKQPLLAAFCLQGYLALVPEAPNATAVRNEIAILEKLSSEKLRAVLKSMENVAATLQGNSKQEARLDAFWYIAESYARVGDIEGALAAGRMASNTIRGRIDFRPLAWLFYAHALAEAGYQKKVFEIVSMVERTFPKPSDIKSDSKANRDREARLISRAAERLAQERGLLLDLLDGQMIHERGWNWSDVKSPIVGFVLWRDPEYRRQFGMNTDDISEPDLDTAIRDALYRFNNPEATVAPNDTIGREQRIIEKTYRGISEMEKVVSGGQILGGPEVALISVMKNAISSYGLRALKYEFSKEQLTKFARSNARVEGPGWLGVSFQSMPDMLRKDDGAYVASVEDRGPAKAAGMLAGDVIISYDDMQTADPAQVMKLIASTPIGEEVRVVVIREEKQKKNIVVKVGRRPN